MILPQFKPEMFESDNDYTKSKCIALRRQPWSAAEDAKIINFLFISGFAKGNCEWFGCSVWNVWTNTDFISCNN